MVAASAAIKPTETQKPVRSTVHGHSPPPSISPLLPLANIADTRIWLAVAVLLSIALFFALPRIAQNSSFPIALHSSSMKNSVWYHSDKKNTMAWHPKVLVYNRIPKAGSSTMMYIISKLAELNDFDYVIPATQYNHSAARDAIIHGIAKTPEDRRTLVCNHFNFPEILYSDQIAYINVMRAPVDRCVSLYYYTRYGDRNRLLKKDILERYGNATMDECLSRPYEEHGQCFNCPPTEQAMAFCGIDGGECNGIEDAMQVVQQAIENIRHHFYVGLTEHLEETMEMLEILYPDFFKGGLDILRATPPQKVSHTRQQYVEPSETSRHRAAEWVSPDVELYSIVQGMFWKLYYDITHRAAVVDAGSGRGSR